MLPVDGANSLSAKSDNLSAEVAERSLSYVLPDVSHQPVGVREIVYRQQAVGKKLPCNDQMPDVRP